MSCVDFDPAADVGASQPCCLSLRDRFDRLMETSAQLNSSLELPTILRTILAAASRLTSTETASIMLADPDSGDLRFEASLDDAGASDREAPGPTVPLDGSIAGAVFVSGEPIAVNDTSSDPRFCDHVDQTTGLTTHSLLAVPLRVNETTIGVVEVVNRSDGAPWSEQDIETLSALANQAAIAIQTARLHMAEVERQRMERELAIGTRIQRGMIPGELSRVQGWEIQGLLRPAREVGGDFYDAFPLPGGRVGLVIADVCGKGVGAALFMALSRTLIRAFSQFDGEDSRGELALRPGGKEGAASHPKETMVTRTVSRANDYIATVHAESSMFFTLFFAVLDPASGLLTYVNGGHEPPVVVGRDGGVAARLEPTGPAIGAFEGAEFALAHRQIMPGEILLAFTDGVTEASDATGALFSEERLLELVTRPQASVSALVERITEALLDHAAGAPQFDDITMLVLRRLPT